MAWIDYLGSGFVILGFFTIVFILIGFLGQQSGNHGFVQAQLTPRKLYLMGAGIAAMGCGWAYWAWNDYVEGESAWYWTAFLCFMAIEHLFRAYQYTREANSAR